MGHQRVVKHAEDIVLTLLLLPIVLLPMLVIALAVAATSRGPILYRQTRYGLDGRSFEIWKFRTMYVVERNEEFRQATRDDARVTPLAHSCAAPRSTCCRRSSTSSTAKCHSSDRAPIQ